MRFLLFGLYVSVCPVASPGMGHWGTPPPEFDARNILQPFFVSTYRPITHIEALIAVTVAGCCKKNFSRIRFCRPNARWLSLLDDFVTTNFGTRAPRVRARPRSKILATPLCVLASWSRLTTVSVATSISCRRWTRATVYVS